MPLFKDNDFSERRQAETLQSAQTLSGFDPATAEGRATRLVAAHAQGSRVKARKAAEKAETERRAVADKIREKEATRLAVENAERMGVDVERTKTKLLPCWPNKRRR